MDSGQFNVRPQCGRLGQCILLSKVDIVFQKKGLYLCEILKRHTCMHMQVTYFVFFCLFFSYREFGGKAKLNSGLVSRPYSLSTWCYLCVDVYI